MSATNPEHIDAVARALHAEHVREAATVGSVDPARWLVEDCGNCQRWARYASTLLTDAAMLDALTRHGVLTVSYGYRDDPPGLGIWQPGLDLTTTRLHALGRPVVSRHTSGWREVS